LTAEGTVAQGQMYATCRPGRIAGGVNALAAPERLDLTVLHPTKRVMSTSSASLQSSSPHRDTLTSTADNLRYRYDLE